MTRHATEAGGWIVTPAFDLLFLANVAWPLLLWPGLVSTTAGVPTEFWQIYFLTAPHRWLTLVLVVLDPDRREGRAGMFLGLAVAAAALVGAGWYAGTWFGGGFLCLALVDYVWNGWHFAAQHSGVLRVYSRKVGGAANWLERHALRGFIFYAILLTAGWSTGWLETYPSWRPLLRLLDGLALSVPVVLLGLALARPTRQQLGRLCYLASIGLLYAALIAAVQAGWRTGVLALTAASATFHAVEYLALVTHYAWRRREVGSAGLFRQLAGRWLGVLLAYLVLLGLVLSSLDSWTAAGETPVWRDLFVGTNFWVSFLHYAYDGLIWKLRRPATAAALGATQVREAA